MTETHHAPARDNKLERIASCSDAQWLELEARAKMLRSVAELPPRSRRRSIATQEAALLLGASLATTYRWLSRYDGQVEDLLPAPPGQPPGRLRLAAPVQAVIDHGIRKHHLSKQKIPLSETVRRIQSDCIRLGLRPPSRKAIQTRLDSFDQREVARCRGELQLLHCDDDLSAVHSSASHGASDSAIRLGTNTGSRIGRERKSAKPAYFPSETASRAGVAATGETDSEAMLDLSPKIYYAKAD